MFLSFILLMYYGLKIFFLFSLVAAILKAEPLREQLFGLALVYTMAVAFLSYVFLIGPHVATQVAGWHNWTEWGIALAFTCILTWIYFRCVVWFENSSLLWFILAAGFLLAVWGDSHALPRTIATIRLVLGQ